MEHKDPDGAPGASSDERREGTTDGARSRASEPDRGDNDDGRDRDVDARRAPLAMHPETFRRVGHELVDDIAEFLGSLRSRPVTHGESPTAVREALGADAPLPEHGEEPGELLRSTAGLLFDHSLFNAHPRFFGYITAPAAPIGMLGDLLASAANPNVGAWTLSPMATEIEAQTVRWIAELIGYPTDCGGLLVSGGNMANMVAFWAARRAVGGEGVRQRGVGGDGGGGAVGGTGGGSRGDGRGHRDDGGLGALRVYGSAETHTWIEKATDLAGLGTAAMRWIPTDDELRMDVDALGDAIRADLDAGDRPMMVVGTGGSVSTGAVDRLHEIAGLCRELDVWFHVDGAYGGFAAAVPDAAPELEALRLADSVAVDPHKWLYSPLEAGCALVRDPQALRDAFSYHPPYYHFGVEATNFVDFGPQNSRGFRALKVWLALRQVGREGYRRMIGDDIRLSERLYERVAEHPELEPVTRSLSITTFRYIPRDLWADRGTDRVGSYLNTLNEELLDRIQLSGRAFVSNAVIRGRYVLRACIVNFNTTEADVDALPPIAAGIGREVDQELRERELPSH
ncbi:MAG: pyridoxal phosphate-dependent decarboxylase family protein [Gemmatimonadota bacterium]